MSGAGVVVDVGGHHLTGRTGGGKVVVRPDGVVGDIVRGACCRARAAAATTHVSASLRLWQTN